MERKRKRKKWKTRRRGGKRRQKRRGKRAKEQNGEEKRGGERNNNTSGPTLSLGNHRLLLSSGHSLRQASLLLKFHIIHSLGFFSVWLF